MNTKKQDVDQQLVRDLERILNETNLTEIEVEHDELRIRVARQAPVAHFAAPAISHAAPAEPAVPVASPAADAERERNLVRSPMVGTAYTAPSPGSRPFIEI